MRLCNYSYISDEHHSTSGALADAIVSVVEEPEMEEQY